MISLLLKMFHGMEQQFQKGGKYEKFFYAFEAGYTFIFTPKETAPAKGTQIRDAIDLKRLMFTVVVAMIPCLLFGIWNVGHMYYLTTGEAASFGAKVGYGAMKVLPHSFSFLYCWGIG